MKNTTFVRAGAGSGKTYRLTQDISRMIRDGIECGGEKRELRAEEIILTTFTKAAAKELREKVRSTLYAEGLYEAAMNIDNAAIGTIHSIAYQLVSRYWYLLGVSANVAILDDENSKFCISQSISSLPSELDLKLFDKVCKSFNVQSKVDNIIEQDPLFWKSELVDLIHKTVELNIGKAELEKACEESKALLAETIGWRHFEITNDIIQDVLKRLEPIFARQIEKARGNKAKKRRELNNSVLDLKKCDGNIGAPIGALLKVLSSYEYESAPAYLKKEFEHDLCYFDELADNILHSNQVKNFIEEYIDTLFTLAIKWKTEYEEFKRERCLLDNNDLLVKFDELLGKDEVVDEIKSRYKVAFVDEFQDCSPLQVKSFERLSELMEQSIWVGDIKQAIYGFRGTNTELVQSVVGRVGNGEYGNKLDRLECCWRSNKTIVDLVNSVFCQVFNGQIPEEDISLKMPNRTESDPKAPEEKELIHRHFFLNGKKENFADAVAEEVKKLIDNGDYSSKDIAILCRVNKSVKQIAVELQKLGIPYNVALDVNSADDDEDTETLSEDISSFINAVVMFAVREDNELSKAIIVNRIEKGYGVAKILTDKIEHYESSEKKQSWLGELGIVQRFSELRENISNQSVSAAIETMIVELNLNDLIKRIAPNAPSYNYCSALLAKATAYESMCSSFSRSSTLVGFAEYLKSNPLGYPGDDNGVTVTTYHKSKGLEWPCVILYSLADQPVKNDRIFFGPLVLNAKDGSKLRLCPRALKQRWRNIIAESDNEFFVGIREATINEAKRLMYVGMTRPKEQLMLVTAYKQGGRSDDWLTTIGCKPLDCTSDAKTINWGGYEWNHLSVKYELAEAEHIEKDESFDVLKQPEKREQFAPKNIAPSSAGKVANLKDVEVFGRFGDRMKVSCVAKGDAAVDAEAADAAIGLFIHHAMCLWSGDESIIAPLAEAYGVTADVAEVAASIKRFWEWMEQTYGKATAIEREVPFSFVNELGQSINGEIDLVYCTDQGDVLVDYKTCQAGISHITDRDKKTYAGKYSGQLALYEEALRRAGRTIRDTIICYISLGVAVRMKYE